MIGFIHRSMYHEFIEVESFYSGHPIFDRTTKLIHRPTGEVVTEKLGSWSKKALISVHNRRVEHLKSVKS